MGASVERERAQRCNASDRLGPLLSLSLLLLLLCRAAQVMKEVDIAQFGPKGRREALKEVR